MNDLGRFLYTIFFNYFYGENMTHTGISRELIEGTLDRLLQPELAAYLMIESEGDGGEYSFEELGRVLSVSEPLAIKLSNIGILCFLYIGME